MQCSFIFVFPKHLTNEIYQLKVVPLLEKGVIQLFAFY